MNENDLHTLHVGLDALLDHMGDPIKQDALQPIND
jgi:hypothetical protein